MACEQFINKRFSVRSRGIIDQANDILTEYAGQDLVLTLRQLYYQFVARGILPNKQSEYKRLGSIINDARLAGLVDWAMMEDRTRHLREVPSWSSPSSIVEACAHSYQEDLWRGQAYRPEVWIEKDALVGVIEGVCQDLRISYFACRGYASQSAQHEAGARFADYRARGQEPVVLHFGDHDPSGMDMTRDNADRLAMFARQGVEVRRLALNMNQVEEYNPPPNPAKETDSRSGEYIARFGESSWELDALEPSVISQLIRTEVEGLIQSNLWRETLAEEENNREILTNISDRWDDVKDLVS